MPKRTRRDKHTHTAKEMLLFDDHLCHLRSLVKGHSVPIEVADKLILAAIKETGHDVDLVSARRLVGLCQTPAMSAGYWLVIYQASGDSSDLEQADQLIWSDTLPAEDAVRLTYERALIVGGQKGLEGLVAKTLGQQEQVALELDRLCHLAESGQITDSNSLKLLIEKVGDENLFRLAKLNCILAKLDQDRERLNVALELIGTLNSFDQRYYFRTMVLCSGLLSDTDYADQYPVVRQDLDNDGRLHLLEQLAKMGKEEDAREVCSILINADIVAWGHLALFEHFGQDEDFDRTLKLARVQASGNRVIADNIVQRAVITAAEQDRLDLAEKAFEQIVHRHNVYLVNAHCALYAAYKRAEETKKQEE